MTALFYILSSVILSGVGLVVYLFFRQFNPGFRLRRTMLWAIVGLSLALPLLHANLRVEVPDSALPHSFATASGVAVHNNVEDFCSCTDPGPRDVILYQASRIYDFILTHKIWLQVLFFGISGVFLLMYIIRLAFMKRIVQEGKQQGEMIEVDGEKVFLVRGWQHSQAGSLRWFGKFIFWNDRLDALPAEDQKSILHHELSHIRQFNTLEKVILLALKIFWFANPVRIFIQRELESLSEYIADEFAARSAGRKAYATLLLRVKSAGHLAPIQLLGGSSLKKRIRVLITGKAPRTEGMILGAFLGFSLLIAGDLFADAALQDRRQDFEVYQFINKSHEETGKTEFCKKCTLETLQQQSCY